MNFSTAGYVSMILRPLLYLPVELTEDQSHNGDERVPGSTVGRVSDPRIRGSGFETRTGHLVVWSDLA